MDDGTTFQHFVVKFPLISVVFDDKMLEMEDDENHLDVILDGHVTVVRIYLGAQQVPKQSAVACELSTVSERLLVIIARRSLFGRMCERR